ncbi:MAG: SDR family NAD(P)-dependent oxidoreductase [Acidobacteria bacterium]|nr:SDR family NAD(P)-dependent oxidoreductase [Acidobacteriota bacterium]
MSRIHPFAIAAGTFVASLTAALVLKRTLRYRALTPGAVVVITGGSRGLGFAIASRFAGKGNAANQIRLVLASRNMAELERAQAALLERHTHLRPEDFYLVAGDLSRPEEADRLISETMARYGRIDVLVNNAGIIEVGPIESQSLEVFERTMKVNFFAALYTTWAALPHMLAQEPLSGRHRASIVNIASVGGKLAVPHMLPYSAAKFALVGFSEGLHAEVRHKGVRVTTVCPGLMRTGGENHADFVGDKDAEQRWFMFAAKTPGVAVTVDYAANRIYDATLQRRAEITISPQAFLAARFAGLFPETLQYANALTNEYLLPCAPETGTE